jgi:hypothetical protein
MPKELPDRDTIIVSMFYELVAKYKVKKQTDGDGNDYIVWHKDDFKYNTGYDVVMTEESDGDIRITLKR